MAQRTAAAEPRDTTGAGGDAPGSGAAISLRGLRRDYGDRPALAGVDVEVGAGSTLAVLGPNGSGKTTLLRVLAGLLRPSGGDTTVLGCELPGETWRLRGRVGLLAHRPLLYRDLSPRENLRLAARLHRLDEGKREERIAALLGAVGMERRADDLVAELSAGMAQRVAACGAVLHDPELLLLDEPDSHLDAEARELVGALIGPSPGRTRVLVSHDRKRALGESDQVLEL